MMPLSEAIAVAERMRRNLQGRGNQRIREERQALEALIRLAKEKTDG